MKINYVLSYTWQDLWFSSNRPFSIVNIIAIFVSVTILTILLGGVLAFRENGEKTMDKLGLRIEVSSFEERSISPEQRQQLEKVAEIGDIHWWKPTLFLFYNNEGQLFDGVGGRTVDLDDPVMNSLSDIQEQKPVKFLSKNEMANAKYDEIGMIVPFTLLKRLSYLPIQANPSKPETWQHIPLPKSLKIRIQTSGASRNISLPIVGIIADFEGGRYLITKDCYRLLTHWQDVFIPDIKDRDGNLLVELPPNPPNESPKPIQESPDTHASVYVSSRSQLLPCLEGIRSLGLRANSALEYYLKDYQQQETFFIVTAGGICLALFLFAGIILFATFYALVLRKVREVGVLKAFGASGLLINAILAWEALVLGCVSITLGLATGYGIGKHVIASYIQKQLQLEQNIWFVLPIEYMVAIFIMGLGFCLLVTFFPVRMAVKVDPDQVIRATI